MTLGVRQHVEPPAAAVPPVSILNAATVLRGNGDWENGYDYQPETCGTGGKFDPCNVGESLALSNFPDLQPRVVVDPVGIWAGQDCSTLGLQARDLAAIVRRLLEAQTPTLIEDELWTGAESIIAAGGDPDVATNPRLAREYDGETGAQEITEGPTSIVAALGCLEAALSSCGGIGRGLIHVPVYVVPFMFANNLVRAEGPIIVTQSRGHVVVPGAGYDGSAPDGTPAATNATWLYGTGPVTIRLGDIEVPGIDDAPAAVVNRTRNHEELRALRSLGLSFDPCCHFVAQSDIDPCGLIGS